MSVNDHSFICKHRVGDTEELYGPTAACYSPVFFSYRTETWVSVVLLKGTSRVSLHPPDTHKVKFHREKQQTDVQLKH